VNSYLTEDFIKHYRALPQQIREQARKNYRLWKQDARHPSLHFKQIHTTEPIYSVRIGRGWRALGLREGDAIYWFWIGSHADYDDLLSRL